MKKVISWLAFGAAATIGCAIGSWLWDEVLKGKMNGFKDRLISKKEES